MNKLTSKEIYRHLIEKISTQPTGQKTITAKLQAIHGKEYVIDWPGVYMLPRSVTMDSATRNFQYRVLNNIVYFNEQLLKINLSDNPYCSFCKSSYENVIHVFSECNVTQKIWSKLREWLSPELNLPALTPQNVILGILVKDAPFDLLINHILILFKQGLYQCRNTNIPPNFYHIKEKIRLIQKIEYKIAEDNDCLFSHLRKWEKILYKL